MSFPATVRLDQGDILNQTVDKRYPLGTRGVTSDGRSFRYCRNGVSTLVVGTLIQSSAPLGAVDNVFNKAPTTNSTKIVLTMSTATFLSTANYFKDGFAVVNEGTGLGQIVRIHSQAKSTASPGTFFLYEADKFTAAPTTASKAGLHKNPYDKVVVNTIARTAVPVGVPLRGVTASWYFWAQTWGICPVVAGATALVIGNNFVGDTVTAGAISPSTKAISVDYMCGTVIQIGASAKSATVFLTLAP